MLTRQWPIQSSHTAVAFLGWCWHCLIRQRPELRRFPEQSRFQGSCYLRFRGWSVEQWLAWR